MPRSRKDRGHSGGWYRRTRDTVFLEEQFCFLCGGFVDQTLYYLDPGAPQLHYVIPITRGGNRRDRQNMRLTHRKCNNDWGNRLPGEPGPALKPPSGRWVDEDTV